MKRPDLEVMCQVDGCRRMHDDRWPMCDRHWLSLAPFMRAEVHRAEGTPSYADVVAQAVRAAGDPSPVEGGAP